jgi:putative drug exporter of the RND superfamily
MGALALGRASVSWTMAASDKVNPKTWMARWAGFVVRTAWFWLIAWPVVALLVFVPAPRIPTLLQDDRSGFLSPEMPSERGLALVRREFPDHAFASRAVVVFVREGGLAASDRKHVADVASRLASRSVELGWRVRAVATTPMLQPFLESDDGQASLILIELPAGNLTHHSVRRARIVRETVTEMTPPEGLRVEMTGDAAIGELLDRTAKRDVDMTTLWAFVAVAGILLFVYRSPVAMLLPFLSIAAALLLSLGLIGWAAANGLAVTGLVEMFVVVILVGSGVDYCLFIFSRYREEMGHHLSGGSLTESETRQASRDSVEAAIAHTGTAILASAGTNVVGLATLVLAKNRDLHVSGPTIAGAIVIATLAVLTLTPALMCLVKPRLLVSALLRGGAESEGAIWRRVASVATRWPGFVTGVLIIALTIPAIMGAGAKPLYDSIEELPPDSSFVQGARLYNEHFLGDSPAAELTLLLSRKSGAAIAVDQSLLRGALDQLRSDIVAQVPLAYFRSLNDPLGQGSVAKRDGFQNLFGGLADQLAAGYYVGKSRATIRVDLALAEIGRSNAALDLVPKVLSIAHDSLAGSALFANASKAVGFSGFSGLSGSDLELDVYGESAYYFDLREVRSRDFRVIAVAVVFLIFVILVRLTRSVAESAVLIAATLLTYFATYGATWMIFRVGYGVEGLGWGLDLLLFIIILSLGQDYNIFVVSRIHEELKTSPPRAAIEKAIRKTGRVVSSCGIIMAATFASMFAGSLLVIKEFAVALSLGILIDTFVVRPLLVPSMILLLHRLRGSRAHKLDAVEGAGG